MVGVQQVIVIRGPAGVGKTTVAKLVAKALNAKYVSYDDIMRVHRLDTIEGDGIPAENFIEANKLVLAVVDESMAALRSVVLDGCFYRLAQMDHLRAVVPAEIVLFSLDATLDDCICRNAARGSPMTDDAVRQVYALVAATPLGIRVDTAGKDEQQIASLVLERLAVQNSCGDS
jgi:predicted kinase